MLCNEHFWNVLTFYEIIESIRRHKTLPHWVHSLTFGMGYWAGVVDDEISAGREFAAGHAEGLMPARLVPCSFVCNAQDPR